jgi:Lrp/AsnC family transcriptional regulator for asnA, asnC and gidA
MNDVDIKIIKELQENGRATSTEVAKRLGMHRSTVSKRIKQLLDNGIINIRALPNLDKLGYRAQALILVDVHYSRIEDVVAELQSDFNVNLILTLFGRSNLLLAVHFFNWENLLNFVSARLSRIEGVNRVETHFISEIKQRYFGIFENSSDVLQIDDVDQKIMERLTENGRHTALHLSNDIGISLPTCLKKIHYLLMNNLITIRALPNPTRFGYVADVFVLLQVKHEEVENICLILGSFNDLHSLYVLFSGSYNILFGIHKNTPEELFNSVKDAINKVSLISTITNMKMYIRSEVKKRYYGGLYGRP